MEDIKTSRHSFEEQQSKKRCQYYRKRILELSRQVTALHIASAFSCLEIVDCIYHDLMEYQKCNKRQDTFVMSKGHGCLIQYVILESFGILSREDLDFYCKPGGQLGCHPDCGVPGVFASTGSLGHGLSMCVGMAYAEKQKANNNRVFCVLSDGELEEGSTWEAILLAGSLQLDNLICFVDNNDYESLEKISKKRPNFYPIDEKLRSFGWESNTTDGHNSSLIYHNTNNREKSKPYLLVCKTTKGKGVSYMENNSIWHYRSPNKEEFIIALDELEKN